MPFAPEVQPELTQPGVPDLFNAPLETLEAVSEEAAAGKPPGEIAAETLSGEHHRQEGQPGRQG